MSAPRAATEIIAAATETQAGLIVLGTHRRTGLARLVLGSVARNVRHHATSPAWAPTSMERLRSTRR